MGKSLFEDIEEPKQEMIIDQLKVSSKLIPIKYEDIVFNPLTQLSCQNCGFYGRTFRCPPYNTPYDHTKKFLKSKYTEYKFYGSAGCHKCRKCAKWLHKPCEYPLDSFSSPEGSGIDLYETLRKR